MHTPSSVFSGAEIDKSNPFANGLLYAVLVRNGSLINMVDRSTVPILNDGIITTNETGQVTLNNLGDISAGINAGLNSGFVNAIDNKVFSTYTKATLDDITGTFISAWQNSAAKFRIRIVPSFNLLLEFGADDFPLGSFFNIPDLRVGIGLTVDNPDGTAYRNGLQHGNLVDVSLSTPPAGDAFLGVGCNFTVPPTVTNALRGADISISLGWDRPLTADEHLSINNDPWQIFKPINRIFLLGMGDAPASGQGVLISGPSQIISTGFKTAPLDGLLVSGPSQIDSIGFKTAPLDGALVSGPSQIISTGFKTAPLDGLLVSGPSEIEGLGTGAPIGIGDLISGPSQIDSTGFKTALLSGAMVSGPSEIEGTGTGAPIGTGDLVSGPSEIEGIGTRVFTGTGDLVSGPSEIEGLGTGAPIGIGDLISGPSQIDSIGFKTAVLSGAMVSGPSEIEGTGTKVSSEEGALVSGPSQINGFGFHVTPVVFADRNQNFIHSIRQQNFP